MAHLSGRRLREELDSRRGEVEAALAVGLPPRDAVLLVIRPAAVLPGGGTPLEAGAAQLLVLVGLLAAQMLAIWTVTELVGRGASLDDVPR